MNPLLFVDARQNPLPWDDDLEVQYTRQYMGKWFVKVSGVTKGSVALLSQNDSPVLPLIENAEGLWSLPYKQEARAFFPDPGVMAYEAVIGGAGEVRVCLRDNSGKLLPQSITKLIVKPGNLTQNQFTQMINEIGLMALSSISCVAYETQGSVGSKPDASEVAAKWKNSRGMSQAADEILSVIDIILGQWGTIYRQPLKSIQSEVGSVSVDKAIVGPQLLLQRKLNPTRRVLTTRRRVESFDCAENQFVGYVIHTLIQLSQGIAVLLRVQQVAQIQHSRQADNLLPEESVRGIETVNDKGHSFNQVLLAKSNELTAKIAELKRISDIMRQQGVTESSIEPTPTVRLMGSPGYSAVFHAYQHMKRQYNHLSHVVSLYDACISGQIRATWQIYELWCFLKLYHATQSEIAGMRPKAGSQTPFEALILQNGELHLPEDQPFQMESIFDNGRHLLVDLRYQAREADLKPDIVMRLTIDHTFTRKFVFDAKYRNYRGQGVDQFVQDVYGTARFKYLEKLPEQPKASFVFHTTYATGFDYWGEAPLYQAVLDAYNKDEANKLFRVKLGSGIEKPMKLQSCSFSGHRYGAISLIPGEDKDRQRTNREQLRKLLHLLLQYHCSDVTYYSLKKSSASLFRLENTCIYCGCTATEVADYKGRGVYYQCPKCQFLWVLHYCSQQKHSILKLMNYHLHRRQDPKTDEWLYECPECGSRFDPKWANPCDCSPPYSSPEVYQCDWEDGYVPEEPEYFRNAPFWSDVQEINNLGYKQISQPFIKDYIPF